MQTVLNNIQPLLPWLYFIWLLVIFSKLFLWAKKKKTSALVFGILTQMFMPDPYAERTVKIVQEVKKEIKRTEDDSGEAESKENK